MMSRRTALSRKMAIEILVCTDPEPHPFITSPESHGAIVSGNANCPGTMVRVKALQSQTRMCGVLRE